MKLTLSSITVAAMLLKTASANFHVLFQDATFNLSFENPVSVQTVRACPSDSIYDCGACYTDHPSRGVIATDTRERNPDRFHMPAGLCGMDALDFYRVQGQGHQWEVYISGRPTPTRVASCYNNPGDITACSQGPWSIDVDDIMWCDNICN